MYFLLLLIPFAASERYSLEDKVNYYVNLIKTRALEAETYKLPTDSSEYRPNLNGQRSEYGTFDYIVIGAGTAGAIVATRLSEECNKTVLLLEAGAYESDFTDIPSVTAYTYNSEYNWNYRSIPQNNSCWGEDNKQCVYRAGKGLGGSSIINGLLYARGNDKDYDSWRDEGNPGWGFDDVLKYFKKLENYRIDDISVDDHGFEGYMNVEYVRPLNNKTVAFLNAARELGVEPGDYNGQSPISAGRPQVNTFYGRRGSTGRAYLRRVWHDRPNLYISVRSFVTKILIDEGKRAHGVMFAKGRQYFVASSRSEIVLSAGAISSPQILMLSGVGPREHLKSLRIPLVQHLPVGNFFKDHLAYNGLYVLTNDSAPVPPLAKQARDYLKGKGELAGGIAIGVAFLQTNVSSEKNYPDIELVQYKFIPPSYFQIPLDDVTMASSLFVVLLHPKSTGWLRLNSSDPFQYPLIHTNFFSDIDMEDRETIYEGIQLALKLINSQALKKLDARLIPVHLSECKKFPYLSKQYFFCQMNYLTMAYIHQYGTCKMGPSPSTGAVVDHRLRVHGIDNLVVADASVMPGAVSGHNYAPIMMIGEKAADMIRFGYV